MKTIVWKPRGSMAHHRSVSKFEIAEEHTTRKPVPGFSQLKPGQSQRVVTDDSVKISSTNNDRITFANGATIHESSTETGVSESGVLTRKSPGGDEVALDESYAWIDQDFEEGFQPAIYFKVQDQFGDYNEWKQSFPEEGGMRLTPPSADDGPGLPSFQLTPDGKLTAEIETYDFETRKMEARMEGEALVAKDGNFQFGIAPPVPMEWLIGG
jgi:hypothetical protein